VAIRNRRSSRGRDPDGDANPFKQRGFLVSAGIIGTLALVGAFVIVFEPSVPAPPGAGAPGADTRPPTSTASAEVTGSGADPEAAGTSACPELRDTSQVIPTEQPLNVVWEVFRGVALPVSKVAGPALADSGTVRCYAQTPTGALIAAAQASERYALVSSPTLAATMLATGPGRDGFITRSRASKVPVPNESEDPDTPQLVGFRMTAYSPQSASVELIRLREMTGSMDSTAWTVVWEDGWKLQLPTSGSRPPARPVQSLTGYAPWLP